MADTHSIKLSVSYGSATASHFSHCKVRYLQPRPDLYGEFTEDNFCPNRVAERPPFQPDPKGSFSNRCAVSTFPRGSFFGEPGNATLFFFAELAGKDGPAVAVPIA